jgi:uncharacterized protein (DUF433 family)
MLDDWQERIVADPKILVGKPVIKGTRLSVEFILDLLADGWTIERILDDYPQLQHEDIMAILKYAAEMVKEEKVYPLSVKFLADENISGHSRGNIKCFEKSS